MGLKFAAQYMLRGFPDIEAVAREVKPPPFRGAPWPGDMEHVVAGCWTIVNALAGHYPPGSFIHAVLMNNLSEAFKRADESNTRMIWSYVAFLYNHVPATLLEEYRKSKTWTEYKEKINDQEESRTGHEDLVVDPETGCKG